MDPAAPPGGDGLLWSTALRTIEEANDTSIVLALDTLQNVLIMLKRGVYTPDGSLTFPSTPTSDPRRATFALHPGVAQIRGGYLGVEDGGDDPLGGASVLSGDIGVSGNSIDNCYHVVVDAQGFGQGDPGPPTELRDLVIMAGNADAPIGPGSNLLTQLDSIGAGVYVRGVEVLLTDTVIRDCTAAAGAGVIVVPSTLGPGRLSTRRATIETNSASMDGGGVYIGRASIVNVQNATIRNNKALRDGAGLYFTTRDSDVTIGNSIVHDNAAVGGRGGGIFVDAMDPILDPDAPGNLAIINSTIAYNSANFGGGVYLGVDTSSSMVRELQNCIVYANMTGAATSDLFLEAAPAGLTHVAGIDHSFVGTRTLGANASIALLHPTSLGYIDAVATGFTPGWENGAARNFKLTAASVCLDQGNDNLLRADSVDIDEDMVTAERYPREYLMIDEAALSPMISTREVDAGVVNNIPDIGVNSINTPFAAICDIGAFERRILFDEFQ